ncbi:MAG TPA: anthrone oxygenase family protein [Vicinamibacteria bacterium]
MSGFRDGWLGWLTFGTALGCGLVGGLFFTFSTFVMPALARIPAPSGIAAMQAINITVITPSVMLAIFGTGVACLALAVAALAGWSRPGAGYVLAGSAVYVVGVVIVTMVCNVPRNNALAAVDAASAEGARFWASFVPAWTAWNHVRTLTGFVGSALLTLALWLPRP